MWPSSGSQALAVHAASLCRRLPRGSAPPRACPRASGSLPRSRPCAPPRPSRYRSPLSRGGGSRAPVLRTCAEDLQELVGLLVDVVRKARHQHRLEHRGVRRHLQPLAVQPRADARFGGEQLLAVRIVDGGDHAPGRRSRARARRRRSARRARSWWCRRADRTPSDGARPPAPPPSSSASTS